ncbi:hypothetical protein [Trinickia fusca]|uniref:hypothetical protein n=1 Tax=Trinickia fusca TaxID=2419777 RepID=UPI0011C48594|nr:hypothetical protein [Trinickia fusca]
MHDAFMNLMRLRMFPSETAGRNVFFVKNASIPGVPTGGRVNIATTLINGINELTINRSESGRDFYFPYVHGVGNVTVGPVNGIAEGTIVVTGGMNGCALEVTVQNNQFVFHHDSNGRCMGRVRNAGATVCRIEANAYWRGDGAERYKYPLVQFICVYRHNWWHVLSFGIYTDGGSTVKGGFDPIGGRYRGYFNENIRLMQR